MRFRIIDTNFTIKHNWIFKLLDEHSNEAFIMNENFYKAHSIKSPITKQELDYYDKGYWIRCLTEEIEGLQVVTRIT